MFRNTFFLVLSFVLAVAALSLAAFANYQLAVNPPVTNYIVEEGAVLTPVASPTSSPSASPSPKSKRVLPTDRPVITP